MTELRIGADVLAADGSRLGRVERLVVDEGAHQVTQVVVHDRLVPIERIQDAGPDGLATSLDEAGFERLPRHDDAGLEAPGEHWRPPEGYRLEHFLAVAGALIGNAPYVPPVHADLTPGEAGSEIAEGSPVWSGEVRIGRVVEVGTDAAGNIRRLVMAREGLRGERVVIPLDRVVEVVGTNLQVDLTETDVDLLEPAEEAAEEP